MMLGKSVLSLPVRRTTAAVTASIIVLFCFLIGMFWFFAPYAYLVSSRLLGSVSSTEKFLIIALFASIVASYVYSDMRRNPMFVLALVVYAILVFSFTTGILLGTVTKNDAVRTTVTLKDERPIIRGKILRSGERGLLLYEPSSNQVRFERWDAVRSVDTALR
jgi:Ca2+/Na+ antiporter